MSGWRRQAHPVYAEVIEERLKAAKAVVVIWSAEAVKSHWVRAEANAALEAGRGNDLPALDRQSGVPIRVYGVASKMSRP